MNKRIEKFKQDYCSKCINTKGCVTCVDGNMAKFANTWVWDEEGKADKQAVKNISKEVSKQIVGQVKDYMKKQEAVEGFIFQLEEYYPKEIIAAYDGELKHGDKVKLIILKDDEQRNTIRDVQGNDKES